MSDVEITKLSSLDLLEEGDSIMAEKGFVLKKVLDGKDISVNTLLFSKSWAVYKTRSRTNTNYCKAKNTNKHIC